MKLLARKILFCATIFIGFISVVLFRTPLHINNDLMSLARVQEEWPIYQMSTRFSSVLNIVVESENEKIALETTKNITKKLSQFNTLRLQTNNFSLKELTKDFIPYKNGFIDQEDKKLLIANQSRKIADNAIKTISESMMPTLVSIKDDPFLLLSNYITSIGNNNTTWTMRNGFLWQYKDGKNYFMLPIDTDLTNVAVFAKQIKDFQQDLSNITPKNVNIHISGAPLHTAIMVQKSQIQLGVLSFLAILMAIIFNYLLFGKMFTIAPVLTALGVGFVGGTIALFLCFNVPHILTFVFGTTLIGLGIDYAFHSMVGASLKDSANVHKNMFYSFLTTLICFLPLLFSKITLLQQISVFTIFGLTIVYVGLLLFVPKKINLKLKKSKKNMTLSHKHKNIIIVAISVIVLFTLPFIKIENNINQMYRPNRELLSQDIFFQNLNNSKQSAFLMVRGKDIENVLQTEEDIKTTGINFFSLSDIIPSKRTQNENQELIKRLYMNQATFLQKRLELRNTPVFQESEKLTIYDIKSEFVNNLINKLIVNDGNYIYSISQIDADTIITNENVHIISPSNLISDNIQKFSHETYRLLLLCTLFLMIVLFAIYRKRAILYVLPSFFGICLTMSVLTWFGQPITFFHLLSFFIIIGLSLDYTIFNINAESEIETRPVLYSFLTSFVGFGLLAFTSFFLIQSMGITLGLGLLFSYLISRYLFSTNKKSADIRK